MNKTTAAIAFFAATTFAAPAFAQYENCGFMALSTPPQWVEGIMKAEDCEAACTGDECIGWSFAPHSFDPSAPGRCGLYADIYDKEPAEKTVCTRTDG